jgi:hypothetical protein
MVKITMTVTVKKPFRLYEEVVNKEIKNEVLKRPHTRNAC